MSLQTKSLSAASKGDLATLKSLRTQINLTECSDKFGATPVHYAARAGRIDSLRWLVQTAGLSGSKPANNGATPAHDAAATGQLDCLQWLIENGGCSSTCRDSCGATPLHLASRFGHLNVVVWLVEAEGCSPLDRAQNGVTPVHLAAAKGSKNCLKWLTQTFPNCVNKRADNGTTPVYFAAQEGRLECLQFLVAQVEGNCRLRASDGMAPVHAAAQMGQLECLAWLIQSSGVSPNEKDNDGATPAHFAAARGHVHVLRWILSHGGSVETDDLGGTPLHDAAEHGQMEALKVLLATGVDPNIRDLDGLNPADLAEECGHMDCANFLRSYKAPQLEHTIGVGKSNRDQQLTIQQEKLPTNRSSKIEKRPQNLTNGDTKQNDAKLPTKSPPGPTERRKANLALITEKDELSDLFAKRSKIVMSSQQPQQQLNLRNGDDPFSWVNMQQTTQKYKDYKVQNPSLLKEVRRFEPAVLQKAPPQKKNLQPTKFGRVTHNTEVEDIPSTSFTSHPAQPERSMLPEQQPTAPAEVDDGIHSDDSEDDEVPLWRRALMKKRTMEQKHKEFDETEKDVAENKKWEGVPAWKRAILQKREAEKAKENAVVEADKQKEAARQARFDALPDWKKKIILQKNKA